MDSVGDGEESVGEKEVNDRERLEPKQPVTFTLLLVCVCVWMCDE